MEEQGDRQFTSVEEESGLLCKKFFSLLHFENHIFLFASVLLKFWANFIFNEPYNPCSPSVYLIDPKPNRTDPKPDKYESKNPYQKSPDRKKTV